MPWTVFTRDVINVVLRPEEKKDEEEEHVVKIHDYGERVAR